MVGDRRVGRGWCLLGYLLLSGSAATADSPWTGFDTTSYALRNDATGYHLLLPGGQLVEVPTEWLEPPGVRAADDLGTVSSLVYSSEVTAFAIGAGRVALHLASYDIQQRGSMQAAVGRDVFLRWDPGLHVLSRMGPDLGASRSRGRVGGCFHASFHHLSVGDVDCDRYLDLAVVHERITCDMRDDGPDRPTYIRGPLRWYSQRAEGWREDPDREGQLPCAGLVDLPLLGITKTPIDFVLGLKRDADPLASGEPEPFPHE